jgi:hypothetical protein
LLIASAPSASGTFMQALQQLAACHVADRAADLVAPA